MNFVGCDGEWTVAGGVLSCAGTVYTYTTNEMAQMFNGVSAATGLSLSQVIDYGMHFGLSVWAIVYCYKKIAEAMDL